MENGESCLKCARRRAALGMWAETIGALMSLDKAGDKEYLLPVTGGWYVLTGRDFSNQTGHKNFEVREGRSPGFLVLGYGSEIFDC